MDHHPCHHLAQPSPAPLASKQSPVLSSPIISTVTIQYQSEAQTCSMAIEQAAANQAN
jgi:hypothetical protein